MHYVSYFIVLLPLLTILARTTNQMLRSEFRQQDSSLVKKWPTGPVRYISEILTHHYE